MAAFLRWLAPKYEAIRKTLRSEMTRLRSVAATGSQHARTPEIFASLALGLHYLCRFAFETQILTELETKELWRRGLKALTDASELQAAHQSISEPTIHFIRLLVAAIASGRAHIAGPDGHEPENPESWGWRLKTIGAGQNERSEWQSQGTRIGWVDGSELYLEPEASYAEAQQLASEQGDTLPISAQTLRKRLNERGLLASVEKGKLTNRRSLEGRERVIIHLRVDTLAQKPGEPGELGGDPPVLCPDFAEGKDEPGGKNCVKIQDKATTPPIPPVSEQG